MNIVSVILYQHELYRSVTDQLSDSPTCTSGCLEQRLLGTGRLSGAQLADKAREIRLELASMVFRARAGHIGGSLSCTDILVSLFYGVMAFRADDPSWPERDRFVLSKGHACEGYYAILADVGFFPKEELDGFMQPGGLLGGHPHTEIPGVEVCSGSLGHGLPVSVGMALAGKMDDLSYRVFTLLGDGELAEGSVYEAAIAASHYRLDNLVCIIDRNRLQISGPTEQVLKAEPLAERWSSFGWSVRRVDGHNIEQICDVLREAPFCTGRPSLVIADTIKGKGVSFMEGDPKWHHRALSDEEYRIIVEELSWGSMRREATSEEATVL